MARPSDRFTRIDREIGAYKPFLRRYARAVLDDETLVSELVRQASERVRDSGVEFEQPAALKLALYRELQILVGAQPAISKGLPASGENPDDAAIAKRRLAMLSSSARQALLLTAMEGFTPEDVAFIMQTNESEVDSLVSIALEEFERQTKTSVLIVEDIPVIAMDLETIVRDLGHQVVAVASTRDEAVAGARLHRPGLILMDIELADGSSGIEAAADILREHKAPLIFITAFPERLLTEPRPEPTFLITKPFARSTVKASISQALFFNTGTLPFVETEPQVTIEPSAPSLPSALVVPRLSPIDAKVMDDQVRLADETQAATNVNLAIVDAARRSHYRTAKRLCGSLAGSNVGPGFNARLDEVRRILSRTLSRERSLQLALEARGLEGMLGAIAERLDDVTAADVAVFVADLIELVKQFPDYREFIDEARSFDPIDELSLGAASMLAKILEEQPDEVVEPDLKTALEGVRINAERQADQFAGLALLRSVGNAFRAIGRALNRRVAGVSEHAAEAFDKTAGRALGRGFASILLLSATAGAAAVLAAALPGEFAFLSQLLKLAQWLLA